jgi:hypothetical protein
MIYLETSAVYAAARAAYAEAQLAPDTTCMYGGPCVSAPELTTKLR